MTGDRELDDLYRKCTSALDLYMQEAHATCSMLGRRIEAAPVTLERLFEQHKRERMAQAKYERIRERMLEILRTLAPAQ